jgi:hypothetical protein
MSGDVTATATVSARNIGIRKPRITRGRKRLSGSVKGHVNKVTHQRHRPPRTAASKLPLAHRLPRLIGK